MKVHSERLTRSVELAPGVRFVKREIKVAIFSSFEDENLDEARRRVKKTPAENCEELAALQVRRWGELWTSTPIERIASWEKVTW